MAINRVATPKTGPTVITIDDDANNKQLVIGVGQVNNPNFETVVQHQADMMFGVGVVFIHLNRDKTVCVATGAPPDVWPEDEPEVILG